MGLWLKNNIHSLVNVIFYYLLIFNIWLYSREAKSSIFISLILTSFSIDMFSGSSQIQLNKIYSSFSRRVSNIFLYSKKSL